MGLGAFLLTFVGAPIIAGTVLAGVYQSFLRETTGIFERWGQQQTIEQRQSLVAAAAAIDINPNTTSQPDGSLVATENHDGDCLTNQEESESGLDPRNPDTDGDGVDDCVEQELGTDPNNALDGGLQPVNKPTGTIASSQLYLDKLVKTANGKHAITVNQGDTVSFRLHVDAYVDGNQSYIILIKDPLPNGLRFIEGRVGETGQVFTTYPAQWEIPVNSGSNQIDIFFTAQVTGLGQIVNHATAEDKSNSLLKVSDTTYIYVNSPNSPPQPPTAYLTKEGRLAGTGTWFHYVFARPQDLVEFRLVANISGTTALLHDSLPPALTYEPSTLTLFYNGQSVDQPPSNLENIFTEGLSLNQGPGEYEIRFKSRVGGEAPFAYTNSARLEMAPVEPVIRTTIVTTR